MRSGKLASMFVYGCLESTLTSFKLGTRSQLTLDLLKRVVMSPTYVDLLVVLLLVSIVVYYVSLSSSWGVA